MTVELIIKEKKGEKERNRAYPRPNYLDDPLPYIIDYHCAGSKLIDVCGKRSSTWGMVWFLLKRQSNTVV